MCIIVLIQGSRESFVFKHLSECRKDRKNTLEEKKHENKRQIDEDYFSSKGKNKAYLKKKNNRRKKAN